jgi:hypothetical protein
MLCLFLVLCLLCDRLPDGRLSLLVLCLQLMPCDGLVGDRLVDMLLSDPLCLHFCRLFDDWLYDRLNDLVRLYDLLRYVLWLDDLLLNDRLHNRLLDYMRLQMYRYDIWIYI